MTTDETEEEDDIPVEGSRDANAPSKIPNAADPARINRARQRAGFAADQRADFWKKILSDPVGRMVMWEVLIGMHTFEDRFANSPAGFPHPQATWFHAGEKAAGWRLYDALRKAAFVEVHTMHQELDPYFVTEKKTPRRTRNG